MATDDTKKEFILEVGSFKRAKEVGGKVSLARKIQTLLLMDPGTMPNMPEMGVGLSDFRFEGLDDTTLNLVRKRVEEQVRRYIPDANLDSVSIFADRGPDGKYSTLRLEFTVSGEPYGPIVTVRSRGKSATNVVDSIVF